MLKNADIIHLEFRQLDGTIEFDKIMAWTKIQKMFIELVMTAWKNKGYNKKITMDLNELICSGAMPIGDVETLMKMSKLVA